MADVIRAAADVAEYDRIAATVPMAVMKEFAGALGVSVPTAEEMNEPPKYSLFLEASVTENIEPDFPGLAELGRKVAQERDKKVIDAILQEQKIEPRARSRTFTAKPCSVCQALREPDTNFTRVYATRDRVRYCKCTYCNNTWKDSDG